LQQQESVSALLVTHDLREAVRLAQFLVFMGSGQILQHGETATVIESPASESIRRLIETQL
jgi:ABC-type proline/glycine betaine transport system ATPase subunit